MTKTREEWIEVANAKSDGGMYTGAVILAKVRNLSEVQLEYFGISQHMPLEKALRGEKAGHWKITDVLGSDREGNVGQEGEL
jgi:hypothetical protein